MNLYSFIVISGLIIFIIYKDIVNDKRINKLLDRLMAKDYKEFNYYDRAYKDDLDVFYKNQEESRPEELKKQDFTNKDAEQFIDGLETDWRAEEIDSEKLEVEHEPSDDREHSTEGQAT